MESRSNLTKRQISFVKRNWNKMSNGQMARVLGINFSTLTTELHKLGLYRMHFEYWTEEQTRFLIKNYKKIGDKELAILFNGMWEKEKRWSFKHIEKKRLYLNLKRSTAEKSAIRQRNKKRGCWLGTDTWKTRGVAKEEEVRIFSHKNGYQYKVIRTKKGFVQYSRWLYEKHIGSIPISWVVTMKDGDSLNVVPENLEAMPRGKLALKNRLKYPELQDLSNTLKQLINTLKQKRNELKKSK